MTLMIRVGIDLGANSIRLINESEILFNEPCMIALDKQKHVLAIGNEALEMNKHKDDSIEIISPITYDKINFDALDLLLEQICYEFKVFKKFHKTILLLSYPTSLAESQLQILKQHLLNLGAYRVYFDREIWFSAIGANLNITLPLTHCMMNIGSSNCDIATFSNGSIQKVSEINLAGNQIMLYIMKWLKKEKNISVSLMTLENIVRKLGNVAMRSQPRTLLIRGTDLTTKEKVKLTINENEIATVLSPFIEKWSQWILRFINNLSEDEKEDIQKSGIIACGGTMKIHGLDRELSKRTQYLIFVTEDPLHTVARGIEILLNNMEG